MTGAGQAQSRRATAPVAKGYSNRYHRDGQHRSQRYTARSRCALQNLGCSVFPASAARNEARRSSSADSSSVPRGHKDAAYPQGSAQEPRSRALRRNAPNAPSPSVLDQTAHRRGSADDILRIDRSAVGALIGRLGSACQ